MIPLICGAGITGIGFLLDDETGNLLEGRNLETMGEIGERMGNHYFLIGTFSSLLAVGHLHRNQRFHSVTYALAQGEVINNVLTIGLKLATGRQRPNEEDRRSFPSGHTSNAFTWATILSHYYGLKVAVPAYVTAAFIGATRLEENAHYLSDVLAGATVGYIAGQTVIRGTDTKNHVQRLNWIPFIHPGGDVFGLIVSTRF